MKWCRVSLLGVICVASLLAAASSAAAASIVGSFHDLSHVDDVHVASIWGRKFDNYREVCVYCHTPHNGDAVQGALWNRPAVTTTYAVYSSETLDAVPEQPGRASKLCLSCHDGSLAVDAVINLPEYEAIGSNGYHGRMIVPRQIAFVDCNSCHHSGMGYGSFEDFRPSFLGDDFSNDHPVGITYLNTTDLVPLPPSGKFVNGVKVVAGKVECTSCHNPHDPANKPFLIMSNVGSALCKTCHMK